MVVDKESRFIGVDVPLGRLERVAWLGIVDRSLYGEAVWSWSASGIRA